MHWSSEGMEDEDEEGRQSEDRNRTISVGASSTLKFKRFRCRSRRRLRGTTPSISLLHHIVPFYIFCIHSPAFCRLLRNSRHVEAIRSQGQSGTIALPTRIIPWPAYLSAASQPYRRRNHVLFHLSLEQRPLENSLDLHMGE